MNWLTNWIFRIKRIRNRIQITPGYPGVTAQLSQGLVVQTQLRLSGKNIRWQSARSIIRNCSIHIEGNDCEVVLEEDALLADCRIFMSGNGQKLRIGKSCRLRNTTFWLEDGNNRIEIGDHTTAEGAHLAATEMGGGIFLGSDCMLSYDIDIRNGDSHVILTQDEATRLNYPADVHIGNHVWIGAHATVLKGVTIGENTVVGTGALVTQSLPDHVLAGGTPARILKEGITWKRDRRVWSPDKKPSRSTDGHAIPVSD